MEPVYEKYSIEAQERGPRRRKNAALQKAGQIKKEVEKQSLRLVGAPKKARTLFML